MPRLIALCAAAALLVLGAGCGADDPASPDLTSPDPEIPGNTPPIPRPNRLHDVRPRTSDTLIVATRPLTNWAPRVLDATCEFYSVTGPSEGYAGQRNSVEGVRLYWPGAFSITDSLVGYARGRLGRVLDTLGVLRHGDLFGPPSAFPPALQNPVFIRDTIMDVAPQRFLNLTVPLMVRTGDPGFVWMLDPLIATTCPWDGHDLGAKMISAADRPHLQHARYWRLVKETVILPGQVNTWEETITRGITQEFARTWERSFSREAGASAGAFGIGASISVTLNSTLGGSTTFGIAEETSVTTTVSQAGIDGVIMAYAQWQLVDLFRVVNSSGGPWSHPNWVVDPASMGPWIVPGSLTVPDVVRFALNP